MVKLDTIFGINVPATMAAGSLVHDLAYSIGNANLTNLNQLDQDAVGLCPNGGDHDHGPGHTH